MTTTDDEASRFRSALGTRLRELREARGWTEAQLADRVGLHRTFFGAIERGRNGLDVMLLPAFAHIFLVEPADLVPARESSVAPDVNPRHRAAPTAGAAGRGVGRHAAADRGGPGPQRAAGVGAGRCARGRSAVRRGCCLADAQTGRLGGRKQPWVVATERLFDPPAPRQAAAVIICGYRMRGGQLCGQAALSLRDLRLGQVRWRGV